MFSQPSHKFCTSLDLQCNVMEYYFTREELLMTLGRSIYYLELEPD